eukprot:367934-Amphidinium_carterae.1
MGANTQDANRHVAADESSWNSKYCDVLLVYVVEQKFVLASYNHVRFLFGLAHSPDAPPDTSLVQLRLVKQPIMMLRTFALVFSSEIYAELGSLPWQWGGACIDNLTCAMKQGYDMYRNMKW